MQVEIPDSLYEKYEHLIKKLLLADDVPSRLQELIESELLRWSEDGERDRLTGCKTRDRLSEEINRVMPGRRQATYRSDFACLDIEDFRTYLDNTGHAAGDRVLQHIGQQLREIYSDADVYRFGGDEFVVELRGRRYTPVQIPCEISLKHSVVRVAVQDNPRRNHYINRFIIFHLDKGIVEATREGTQIACELVTS